MTMTRLSKNDTFEYKNYNCGILRMMEEYLTKQYQILGEITQKVIYNACGVVIFYTENSAESDFLNATIWES